MTKRARACICGRVGCQRHIGTSGWARYAAKFPERADFYKSGVWKFARERHLADNPSCVVCGQPASHVDHRVNIASGGSKVDPSNLQSMCPRHHRAKTTVEGHAGNKRAAQRRRQGG